MASFVESRGVDGFVHVNDERGRLWARYGVTYQPAFVLMKANGTTETRGALGESELQSLIDELF